MKLRKKYTCPLEITHDIIKGKWKPIIIWTIGNKRKSLTELQHSIIGISQKMLLEQIKELIEYKIVEKKSFQGFPLKVEYFLTQHGKKLLSALEILQDTGKDILGITHN
jgi:DNA-binding HxlR family transcriptional regulator